MALNKDTLGAALHARRQQFGNKTHDELIELYGSLDAAALEMAKADADEIIKHIKTFGLVTTAGTATNQTGTMQ